MDGHVVAYGYIVAYLDGGFLVEGVQHRAVLYVDAVADAYGVDISAQHGVEPYAAVVADGDIAYELGCGGEKASLAVGGSKAA